MFNWLDLFRPFRVISKKVMTTLIAAQVAVVLGLWWFFPMDLMPKPHEILAALGKLWGEGLGVELWTSLTLNLEAITISLVLSLILSYLSVVAFFRPLVKLITKFRFLSMVGLTFVFTILTHGGHNLKVSLLVFGLSVFYITPMSKVVLSVPQDEIDYARSLRMSDWHVVWEIIILGKADAALEILRQNAAMGWMMLTMVEGLVRGEGGVGAMLLNENKHFKLDAVFAIQLTIIALGLMQDYAIGLVRNLACPYAKLAEGRE